MADYDADPIAALSAALGGLLGRPNDEWPRLLDACDLSPQRHAALLCGQPEALDQLATELNESRRLAG